MGTQGAAIATVFAQIVSVVVSFFLICKKELPFTVKNKNIRIHKVYLKKNGWFWGADCIAGSACEHFIFDHSGNRKFYGSHCLGRCRCRRKVCAFIMLISSAFMQSMSAFVAQNYGAGQITRARKSLALRHCRFFFHWRGNVF